MTEQSRERHDRMLDAVMNADTIADANRASGAFRDAYPDEPVFVTFPMGSRGHVTVRGSGPSIVGVEERHDVRFWDEINDALQGLAQDHGIQLDNNTLDELTHHVATVLDGSTEETPTCSKCGTDLLTVTSGVGEGEERLGAVNRSGVQS